MASLNCYRLLRPDTEHSAPVHSIKVRREARVDSKRQLKMSMHAKMTTTTKAAAKKALMHDQVPKWRQPKPIVPKTQVQLKEDFTKDLWSKE